MVFREGGCSKGGFGFCSLAPARPSMASPPLATESPPLPSGSECTACFCRSVMRLQLPVYSCTTDNLSPPLPSSRFTPLAYLLCPHPTSSSAHHPPSFVVLPFPTIPSPFLRLPPCQWHTPQNGISRGRGNCLLITRFLLQQFYREISRVTSD